MDISKEELQKILDGVTEEFSSLMKAEETANTIAKADEDSKKSEPPKADDADPVAKDKGEAKEASTAGEAPAKEAAASEAPPPEGTLADAPDAGAKGEGEAEAGAPAMGGEDMDPDQLCEMFMQLSPDQLAMYWMAASKAMFHQVHAHEGEEAIDAVEGAEPMVPEASEAAEMGGEAQSPPPFAKSVKDDAEYKSVVKKNADLEAQVAKLEKQANETSESLAKFLSLPNHKGFASGNVIAKSETSEMKVLTKSDVVEMLNEKARDASLTAIDRKKLMSFTMNPVLTPELKTFLGIK